MLVEAQRTDEWDNTPSIHHIIFGDHLDSPTWCAVRSQRGSRRFLSSKFPRITAGAADRGDRAAHLMDRGRSERRGQRCR